MYVDLTGFENGKLQHMFNEEIDKAVANINNQMTDPTKVRKIVITFAMCSDRDREQINIAARVDHKFPPVERVAKETRILGQNPVKQHEAIEKFLEEVETSHSFDSQLEGQMAMDPETGEIFEEVVGK